MSTYTRLEMKIYFKDGAEELHLHLNLAIFKSFYLSWVDLQAEPATPFRRLNYRLGNCPSKDPGTTISILNYP